VGGLSLKKDPGYTGQGGPRGRGGYYLRRPKGTVKGRRYGTLLSRCFVFGYLWRGIRFIRYAFAIPPGPSVSPHSRRGLRVVVPHLPHGRQKLVRHLLREVLDDFPEEGPREDLPGFILHPGPLVLGEFL
jgi:hypothetical protein